MTSLDEKILAMTEKVECLWFDWYAASCSFANQQIIAIHLNKGSLLKNVLFLAACETQVTTHCFAVNVPIASSCKMKVVEHEREDLCAAAIYLFEFEFVSPLASYQPACYKHCSCSKPKPEADCSCSPSLHHLLLLKSRVPWLWSICCKLVIW